MCICCPQASGVAAVVHLQPLMTQWVVAEDIHDLTFAKTFVLCFWWSNNLYLFTFIFARYEFLSSFTYIRQLRLYSSPSCVSEVRTFSGTVTRWYCTLPFTHQLHYGDSFSEPYLDAIPQFLFSDKYSLSICVDKTKYVGGHIIVFVYVINNKNIYKTLRND